MFLALKTLQTDFLKFSAPPLFHRNCCERAALITTGNSAGVSTSSKYLNFQFFNSVSQRELDYVRQYFVATYGKEKANAIFRTFNEINKKHEISAQRICTYLNQRTRYEVRLQLLHFLFGIAQADGAIRPPETNKIREIAGYLRVALRDFESIMAMFIKSGDNAYKILEIDKTATEDEIKKAYRTMAKKYHPDRVNTENEAIKKGAEEKFKEVQKAYEHIQQERGMV